MGEPDCYLTQLIGALVQRTLDMKISMSNRADIVLLRPVGGWGG